MSENEKTPILLTGDTRMGSAEERTLLESKHIAVTPEQMMVLAKFAHECKMQFDAIALAGMSMSRALRIRELRKTSSWRQLAGICFKEWGADALWAPESNQLAGMALCEAAAALLKEDPKKFPWQATQ